eukprot:gene18786-20677_t
MNKLTIILLFVFCAVAYANKYTERKCSKNEDGQEYCEKIEEDDDDDDDACFYEDDQQGLFQWDPIERGYERELELEEGKHYKVITRALKPKLFEIPDFLTDEECEHIMALAESQGLSSSGLHIDEFTKRSKSYLHGRSKSDSHVFHKWDKNNDGVITIEDVKKFAVDSRFLYMEDKDIIEMFKVLGIKEFDDDKITREEFENLNTGGLNEYMKDLRENHPRFRDRFSEQTWIRQGTTSDAIMRKIRERVTRLTKLSKSIIEGSEPLQVVHYNVNGHYHAHFDGQSKKQFGHLECCHFVADGKTECRLCRFITILYYLNDVEKGGETAFPVADNENYNHEEYQRRKKGDKYNLSKFCLNASVVVAPKRGTAVMWYNHDMDKNGWLGEMDYHSLHGGCDIIKGEKWIANNWITSPESDSYHRTSLYTLEDKILSGEEDYEQFLP